jgi:hypothetical protein
MRILITQRELVGRAGSELFTIDVATELSRRGHEVAVFCPRWAEIADLLFSAGVVVKERLSEVPWVPDIIHGQHHLGAMAALSRFLHVPAIYYCHGIFPWVEQAPVSPRIQKYVVMCEWMRKPVSSKLGIDLERIVAVPNFVDARRFSYVRSPARVIQEALLFANSLFPPDEMAALEAACAHCGIRLSKIGSSVNNVQSRPEFFLRDYDLVFASGRSAIEALAAGCAVVPLIPGQAGQLVTGAS